MKLTNDAINQAAAELLGYCNHEWGERYEAGSDTLGGVFLFVQCGKCQNETLYGDFDEDRPNFIHDANAVRELVRWFMEGARPDQEDKFEEFVYGSLDALAKPPKYITLAILYAVGKITIQDACEAMEGDDE